MMYNFPTFKFYILNLLFLFLLFMIAWLPKTEIELTPISEPLLLDFEVNLSQDAQWPLFNLSIISSKIINFDSEEELNPDYILIDELRSSQTSKMIVFLKEDLQKIAEYKTKNILDNFSQNEFLNTGFIPSKEVLEFHPLQWKIRVLSKDLEKGRATLLVSIKEDVFMKYDLKALRNNMTSRRLTEINETLIELPGMKNVVINNWPKFWKRSSLFSSRVKIIVK